MLYIFNVKKQAKIEIMRMISHENIKSLHTYANTHLLAQRLLPEVQNYV